MKRKSVRATHKSNWLENEIIKYSFTSVCTPLFVCLFLLIKHEYSPYLIAIIATITAGALIFAGFTLLRKLSFQFGTLSNLLESISNGDCSLRGRLNNKDDSFNLLIKTVNSLADKLVEENCKSKESEQLLNKVINHIDVAVIAVNERGVITFTNSSAARLLRVEQSKIISQDLKFFNLDGLFSIENKSLVELEFSGLKGRFYVCRDAFYEQGKVHQLFFINDVQKLLQDQERQSWQNLLRVLSHEINNSLSPIRSIGDTLLDIAPDAIADPSKKELVFKSLSVIRERTESLLIFVARYQQLTTLPMPQKQIVSLSGLLKKLVALFKHREIRLSTSLKDIELYADPSQLEQVLINVIKNADEATPDDTAIEIDWGFSPGILHLYVKDRGVGIINSENIFVPFYSTKRDGSGIGLVLSRRIINNHGGELYINNREDTTGAVVTISLPLIASSGDIV